ncbi:TPA: CPBP family intramembrane metalloprotease [Thermoplasmata archaeon]|nr:CPBP family intramembrane metalloprotease [Thermoplasmata archaeon]
MLYIGVPLAAAYFAMTRDLSKLPKYLLGGGITIGAAEVVLVLTSGVIFGFAHFEGWGAWKIFPSGLAGVAFGYMFLRHGLPAAIMLHFSFDYLSMPLVVFEDSIGLLLVVGISILLWLAVGSVFVVYYTIRLVEFVTKRTFFDVRTGEEGAPPFRGQRPRPVTYGNSPGGYPYSPEVSTSGGGNLGGGRGFGPGGYFICPACGGTAARWLGGGLQCMRCGRIFK